MGTVLKGERSHRYETEKLIIMCQPKLTIDDALCFVLRANRPLTFYITMDYITVRPPL
jgi:hypothetical protein